MFTQPLMYKKIAKQPTTLKLYTEKLVQEGTITQQEYEDEVQKYDKICEDAYLGAKNATAIHNRQWLDSPWHGFFDNRDPMKYPSTGVPMDTIQHITEAYSTAPEEPFKLHSGDASVGGICQKKAYFLVCPVVSIVCLVTGLP